MSVEITADFSEVSKDFRRMSLRAGNFKPVFRWFIKELQVLHMANFRSQGSVDGTPWKPLDPQYASWKLEHYGAKGILVRDGRLRDSLVFDNARGAVREVKRTSMRFGTDLPHAKFHQYGTRNMAKRSPVITNEAVIQHLADNIAEHITEGSLRRTARRLRSAGSRIRSTFS